MASDIQINFWEIDTQSILSPEQIWQKLKAIEVYETTNVLMLLYKASDKKSFLSLTEAFKEFKDNNTVGAYTILVAVVDPQEKKLVKSQEAREAMLTSLVGASSYVEVELQAKTNIKTLDLHLSYVIDPAYCQAKMS